MEAWAHHHQRAPRTGGPGGVVAAQVMAITSWRTEAELVELVNNCDFGLGSNVFAASQARARLLYGPGWRRVAVQWVRSVRQGVSL